MQSLPFGINISVAPTLPAIPVAGVGGLKRHLRILGRDTIDEDLEDYIFQAMEYIESMTLHTATSTQYVLTMDRFPSYFGTNLWPYDFVSAMFKLPRYPVQSVSSIQYTDVEGNAQTLDPSTYQVARARKPCRILPVNGQVWPFTNPFKIESVAVSFVAGYGSQDAIPYRYRMAVKFLAGWFYENRSAYAKGGSAPIDMPNTLKSAINSLKLAGFTQW